jgi:DNA polymerase III epsilon subunit-like protein
VNNLTFEFKLIAALVKRLNKPMTIFDLEGTGFRGPNFGITEVSAFSVMPDGRSFLYGGLVNPENTITAKAREITGITQSMVRDKDNWGKKYAQHFDKISREHIISGFNVNTFDIPAVIEQNARYGVETPKFSSVVDVRRFYLKAAGIKGQTGKLVPVAQAYGVLPQGNAHRATADVIMTVELLEALLRTYGDTVFMELLEGSPLRNRARSLDTSNLVDDIVNYVQANGFTSYEDLASALDVDVSDVEYPLCRAVDSGALEAFQFAHAPTRAWLKRAVPALFAGKTPFDGKLKPIYDALTLQQPAEARLSYLQLRIGLLDAGYVWGMLKPAAIAA